jgi:eukaryotic-like serine/threonine-protein kinase
VSGISWFEARAYCESLGKSLPTFGHWRRAASAIDETLPFNNFNAEGKAPVGSHAGLSRYGAYDMAGNVREWVVNASGDDRYVLGGAFNQPEYLFEAPDVLPPDARLDDVGVRCMKSESEVPDSLRGPLPALRHDFREDVPIADDVYAAVTAQFSYDRVPFSSETLSRDDSDRRWIRETVSYPAPYGDERIVAHLYLPRNALPPYQTIVYFPGTAALSIRDSSTIVETNFFDFVPASGRVLVYPIYQRMYERRSDERLSGASAIRDLIVQWSKEVSRTVDYLETREDVDADRLAFVGLSLGGYYGPIFVAMEPRFGASVFIAGGLSTGMEKTAAEIHPLNHAPRITAPTLMVSGRWDFLRDIELEQQPLYDAIGLEEPEKRFAILDGGHMPDWNGVIRETLDWLGLHLGPFARRGNESAAHPRGRPPQKRV